MMSAPLDYILFSAAHVACCREADIRLGFDEPSYQALGIFGWLASKCSLATKAQAATHAGRPLWVLLNAVTDLEAKMAANADLAQRMSDSAVALLASADMARRRERIVEDQTPEAIARRLIQPGPSALTVGSAQLRQLAAAYLAMVQDTAPISETTHV